MLYKQLKKFRKRKPQMFCTPGHKGKMPRCFSAGLDVTELAGTDNLYNPQGIIKEAEENAAKIFGVKELLFLTSGATQGIFAMLGAFKNRRVEVPRNAHKSIFEACQLFNIEPVFEGEEVAVAARLIVYPDYYGNTIDIKSVYEDCKRKGIYLLVDSAHGSHFGFSPRLPESAAGHCDFLVMSAHKTLPALTQGAYLAINNTTLADGVKKVYKGLGTTSPSYPIMASLDYAAEYLKRHGTQRFERLYNAVQKFKSKLPSEIKFCESDDFTRMSLDLTDFGTNGFFAEGYFNKLGIYPEFSDFRRVIFILSVCDTPAALHKIAQAIKAMKSEIFITGGGICPDPVIPPPERAMPFLEAGNADREYVGIAEAEGRVAASEVGFYPPGIPLVVRGEVLTDEICDIIKAHRRAGEKGLYEEKLFGLWDEKVMVVK